MSRVKNGLGQKWVGSKMGRVKNGRVKIGQVKNGRVKNDLIPNIMRKKLAVTNNFIIIENEKD